MMFLTATEQQDSLGGMANMLDMLLLVMLILVAAYGLYTVIRLKKEYLLFPNKFLYPSGCTPETCLDQWGYIDFIIPRLTILSVACLVMGVAYGIKVFLFPEVNNLVIELATIFLPFGTLLWYAIVQNKASKTFW